ncbi:MAG: response regulator [Proteobacteria bacterium]|nr:response regulator [Pseudomonadota bacterium]NIS71695.1 response regulator [Pseudomonadota bacterium]
MTDRPSVLVVDDELGPRESLRMILKPSCEVATAASGAAALRFLERHPVDLITLDLKMPGLPGMEILKKIRQRNPDVMVIIVTGYGTFRSVVEAIRSDVFDYISKPFSVPEIRSVVERCLEMRNTKLAITDLFREIGCDLGTEYGRSLQDKTVGKIWKLLGNPVGSRHGRNGFHFLEFARALSSWIEKRDPYTTGHSERVGRYTDFMAQELGLSDSAKNELQIAAYLHDIGKVWISTRFMKREGKISSTDWAILKRHPIKSIELMEPLNLSKKVISSVRHHHERFDGTGYPDGLAGSDIPLGAQVIAITNMYDRLTSKMPYRAAMDVREAEAEIRRSRNICFESGLTGKFLGVLKEQRGFSEKGSPRKRPEKEGL